jgi:hypothetical protein
MDRPTDPYKRDHMTADFQIQPQRRVCGTTSKLHFKIQAPKLPDMVFRPRTVGMQFLGLCRVGSIANPESIKYYRPQDIPMNTSRHLPYPFPLNFAPPRPSNTLNSAFQALEHCSRPGIITRSFPGFYLTFQTSPERDWTDPMTPVCVLLARRLRRPIRRPESFHPTPKTPSLSQTTMWIVPCGRRWTGSPLVRSCALRTRDRKTCTPHVRTSAP